MWDFPVLYFPDRIKWNIPVEENKYDLWGWDNYFACCSGIVDMLSTSVYSGHRLNGPGHL